MKKLKLENLRLSKNHDGSILAVVKVPKVTHPK